MQYVLHSEKFISQRTMTKVDSITNSMAENGLYEFYSSTARFNLNLRQFSSPLGDHDDDDDIPPLTMLQFKRIMIIVLSLNAFAMIAFVTEPLISKWAKWRKRKCHFHLVLPLSPNNHFILSLHVCLSLVCRRSKHFAVQRSICEIEIKPKTS